MSLQDETVPPLIYVVIAPNLYSTNFFHHRTIILLHKVFFHHRTKTVLHQFFLQSNRTLLCPTCSMITAELFFNRNCPWFRPNLKFMFILMLILVLPFLWIWCDSGIILAICENMMILINMGRETLPWLSFPKLMCDVFIVIYDSIISFFYLGSDEKGNHKKALTKRDQASNGYSSALVNLTVDIKMR